jgi:iron complex outermembrane receptor protein
MFVIAVPSYAQKNEYGSIKGPVSTSDGKPAAWVTVIIKNTTRTSLTNEDGSFEFKKIKAGSYVLVFSLIGFAEKKIETEIKPAGEYFYGYSSNIPTHELQKVIVASRFQSTVETNPSSSLRLNMPLNEIAQNITVTQRHLLTDQGLVTMSEAIQP